MSKKTYTEEDLSGQKFSRLTVLSKLNEKNSDRRFLYQCQCDCGKIVKVPGKALKSGNTKSCGCLQKEKALNTLISKTKLGFTIGQDLQGKKFGKLTVLQEVEPIIRRNGKPTRQWLCQFYWKRLTKNLS